MEYVPFASVILPTEVPVTETAAASNAEPSDAEEIFPVIVFWENTEKTD